MTHELDKNHRVTDKQQEMGIMKATGMDNCPVKAYKLYITKLNLKSNLLFQRPKQKTPNCGPWYDNMVVGVKTMVG